MRKTVLALTISASILALSACSDKNAGDEVLVTSKAGDITKSELYEDMKNEIGEQKLQLLVIEKVLSDKYKVTDKEIDSEYKKTEEQLGESFEQSLAQEGLTPESYKDVLRLNALQEKALIDGVELTDEEIVERVELMNTEVSAQHVLVADEETALEVKKKIDGGADFAEIAKEYSTEPAAQESGGDLGWFGYGAMVPEFQEAAFSMELNKISEPVQSQHGFHIIKVTDKREIKEDKVTKDDKDVQKALLIEKADPNTIVEKIAKLMKEADVSVKDADLKESLAMFLQDEKEADTKDEDKEEDKK